MSTLSTNVKTSPMFTTETFHNLQVQDLKQGCSQHPKCVGRKTLLPLVLDGQGIFLEGGVPKKSCAGDWSFDRTHRTQVTPMEIPEIWEFIWEFIRVLYGNIWWTGPWGLHHPQSSFSSYKRLTAGQGLENDWHNSGWWVRNTSQVKLQMLFNIIVYNYFKKSELSKSWTFRCRKNMVTNPNTGKWYPNPNALGRLRGCIKLALASWTWEHLS